MEREKLNEILEKHKKWLNNEEGGERANLCNADLHNTILGGANLCGANLGGANLCSADLGGADLRSADLRGAILGGANLDYSAWPLWCGSLKAYVDDRIAIQLLYHTLSVVQHSPYVSDELKRSLLTPNNIDAANRFHRVEECGKLEVYNADNS